MLSYFENKNKAHRAKGVSSLKKRVITAIFLFVVMIIQHIGAMLFSLATRYFMNFRVCGKENVKKIRALLSEEIQGKVIAANHISDLDPFFICSLIPFWQRLKLFPVIFLAKQELFATRRGNIFFRLLGCIPVGEGRSFAVRNVIKEIRAGCTIFIFPEGEVSLNGKIGNDLRVVAVLAKFNPFVFQPVWIGGIKNFREDRHKILMQEGRLVINFGNPTVVQKGAKIDAIEKIKILEIKEAQSTTVHNSGG